MHIVLSHAFAYRRLSDFARKGIELPRARINYTYLDCAHKLSDIAPILNRDLGFSPSPKSPVEIIAPSNTCPHSAKSICVHRVSSPLSQNSLLRISRNTLICSPELVFALMARYLPFAQLAAFGCELCGTYIINKNAEHGMLERPALTSAERLNEFLNHECAMRGAVRARKALDFVIDGSHSPRETMTFLLLCLPNSRGGYAVARPELNSKIFLDEKAQALCEKRFLRGDLVWKEHRLDVEYDGSWSHDGKFNSDKDAQRIAALRQMGWQVERLSRGLLDNPQKFDLVAQSIARQLGCWRAPRCKDFPKKSHTLFWELRAFSQRDW